MSDDPSFEAAIATLVNDYEPPTHVLVSSRVRWRCMQCDKLIADPENLVEHPMAKFWKRQLDEETQLRLGEEPPDTAYAEAKLEERYHRTWGRRGQADSCGPVEVETISHYQDCFETFVGETL